VVSFNQVLLVGLAKDNCKMERDSDGRWRCVFTIKLGNGHQLIPVNIVTYDQEAENVFGRVVKNSVVMVSGSLSYRRFRSGATEYRLYEVIPNPGGLKVFTRFNGAVTLNAGKARENRFVDREVDCGGSP